MPHTHYQESQKTALRSWLKLLSVSNQMRKILHSRLMASHGISLSRFDVLANLYRAPSAGLRLSDLSAQLMVSNGNVTQVMAPLVKDGLVIRRASKTDARVATASLSAKGRAAFEAMAADHARWVENLLASISPDDQQKITQILGQINLKED
jgi:DNA-binding MarR family transcriptional regulator